MQLDALLDLTLETKVDSLVPLDPSDVFQGRVCNDGEVTSDPTTVDLFGPWLDYSTSPDDLWNSWSVPALLPGHCHALSAYRFGAIGPAYVVAVVNGNGAADDANRVNNEARSFVTPGGVDLAVEAIQAPARATGNFEVLAQVCNRGFSAPPSSTLVLYASTDQRISGSLNTTANVDLYLGQTTVPSLGRNRCFNAAIPATAPADGEYFLGVLSDEVGYVDDADRSNNVASRPFSAGSAISRPDLAVASVSAPTLSSLPSLINVAVDVCNRGEVVGPIQTVWALLARDPRSFEAYDRNGQPYVICGPARLHRRSHRALARR